MAVKSLEDVQKVLLEIVEWVKDNEFDEDGELSWSILDLEAFVIEYSGDVEALVEDFILGMAYKGYNYDKLEKAIKEEIKNIK